MTKVVSVFKKVWKVIKVILVVAMIIVMASVIRKNSELKEDVAKMESIVATQEEDAVDTEVESSGLVALDEEVQRQVEEDQIQNEEIELIKTEMAELQRRLNLLEKEGNTDTGEADSEKSKATSSEEKYLNIKFPFDGNYYRDTEGILFYTDPTCTQKISDVRLMSKVYDDGKADNGLSILCWRMDNGEFCYSTGFPNLVTEAEYQMLSEK